MGAQVPAVQTTSPYLVSAAVVLVVMYLDLVVVAGVGSVVRVETEALGGVRMGHP